MEQTKTGNYDEVKAAILRRYDISEETYHQRFRAAVKEGESHRELAIHLQDAAEKWTKDCGSVQQIREAMVIEQLLNMLPEQIRIWVKERKPKTSMAAGELADDYLQAPKVSSEKKADPSKKQKKRETPAKRWCRVCESGGHWTSDCHKKSKSETDKMMKRNRDKNSIRCFNCDRKLKGHIAVNCPEAANYCDGDSKLKPGRSCKPLERRSFYSACGWKGGE